ncbi:MAG: hypothetical protein ABJG14_17680 [Sulfitobacter sp.]|uniref:hypothetical protein n=1 Tax=Alphaproteobacteria TaxID=28211 RepID=UPI003267A701
MSERFNSIASTEPLAKSRDTYLHDTYLHKEVIANGDGPGRASELKYWMHARSARVRCPDRQCVLVSTRMNASKFAKKNFRSIYYFATFDHFPNQYLAFFAKNHAFQRKGLRRNRQKYDPSALTSTQIMESNQSANHPYLQRCKSARGGITPNVRTLAAAAWSMGKMRSAKRTEKLVVKENTAAAMFDMTSAEFRQLVAQGALPSPEKIGNLKRWRVDLLHAVFDAEAARPEEEFTLRNLQNPAWPSHT